MSVNKQSTAGPVEAFPRRRALSPGAGAQTRRPRAPACLRASAGYLRETARGRRGPRQINADPSRSEIQGMRPQEKNDSSQAGRSPERVW